jgi:hypothetical protein
MPSNLKPKLIVERSVRDYLDRRVHEIGGETRALKYIARTGAPDVLVLLKNEHFFVETKRPKGKATKRQLSEHETLRLAGCLVYVAVTFAEVDSLINIYK